MKAYTQLQLLDILLLSCCLCCNFVSFCLTYIRTFPPDAPQREVLRHNISITSGDHLHLNCSAMSNPPAAYTWTSPLAASNLNRTSCCPTVDHINSDHVGEYTCVATNIVGSITVVFYVNVKSKLNLNLTPQIM